MPTYPQNNRCTELGCKEPRSKLNSFCINHGGKAYLSKESDSIYQTSKWRNIRQRQLSIQPLCQACLSRGKVESAVHVDHVFPWKQINTLAFTYNIFQSLCHADHSHKTALEKQGKCTHYTPDGERHYTKADYAFIVHDAPS
jgi:5-methylcytosine-specific restriction endonuclease McrA